MYKGMVTDVLPSQQPEGTYRFASHKYIDINGNVGDEPGALEVLTGYPIICCTAISPCGNTILLAYDDTQEKFIISLFREGETLQEILRTSHITPDLNRSFKAEVTYNDSKERILVWTNDSSPYILNLDSNSDLIDQTTRELLDPNLVGVLKLFKEFKVPVFESASENPSGGSLLSGAYSFALAYEYEDGSILDYCCISNQVNVTNGSGEYSQYDGCPAGTSTSRSISLVISNIDQRYNALRIAVIKRVGGVVSAVEIGSKEITGDTMGIYYAGNEHEIDILLEEVLVPTLKYDRVKTFSFTDKYLALANFSTDEIYNYQLLANQIKSNWVRDRMVSLNNPEQSHRNGGFTFYDKSFMPGEVYAFYIAWVLKDGRRTPKFHIPGRKVDNMVMGGTYPENTPIVDVLTDPANASLVPFLSEDVKIDGNIKLFHTRDTAGPNGKMGYWENVETYPSDFPLGQNQEALANQPIRHHRFPSVRELANFGSRFTVNSASQGGLPILGKISHNNWKVEGSNTVITGYAPVDSAVAPYFDPVTGVFIQDCLIEGSFSIGYHLDASINNQDILEEIPYTIKLYPGGGLPPVILYSGMTGYHAMQDPGNPNAYYYAHNVGGSGQINELVYAGGYITVEFMYQGNAVQVFPYWMDPANSEEAYFEVNVHDVSDITDLTTGVSSYCLGINFEDILLHEASMPGVQGFEIYYAKRNLNSSTVAFQSIPINRSIFNNPSSQGIPEKGFYPSTDLLANNTLPAIGVNFIKAELFFEHTASPSHQQGWEFNGVQTTPPDNQRIFSIKNAEYIPYNYIEKTPQNFSIEIDIPLNLSETSVLVSVCSFKENVYPDFNRQELVSLGRFFPISTNPATYLNSTILDFNGSPFAPATFIKFRSDSQYSGDTFIDISGFRLYKLVGTSVPCISLLMVSHTALPAGLRYEGKNAWEKYYPKTAFSWTPYSLGYPAETDEMDYNNFVEINTDYAKLNDFIQPVPNTKNIRDRIDFPDDICFAHIKGNDGADYARFLPRNYFKLSRIRGAITNTEWSGRNLIINTESSVFRTVTQRAMKTDEEDIILGSADLFAMEPEEVITSKDQYGGCQHISGCYMTKMGYFFIDGRKGKIFLLTDSLSEISNFGNKKYMEPKFKLSEEFDTYDHRYNLSYDEDINRILVSKYDSKNNSFVTMSYSTLTNMWASTHNYQPISLFSNRFGAYGVLGNSDKILKFSDFQNPRKFHDQTFPSVIDIPITQGVNPFITSNLIWDSWAMHVNGAKIEDKTFNKIALYNSHQCSFEISVEPRYSRKQYWVNKFWDVLKNMNLPFMDSEFSFILSQKDDLKPWDAKKRFIDDHVVVRLISDLHPDIFVYLSQLNIKSRPFKIV